MPEQASNNNKKPDLLKLNAWIEQIIAQYEAQGQDAVLGAPVELKASREDAELFRAILNGTVAPDAKCTPRSIRVILAAGLCNWQIPEQTAAQPVPPLLIQDLVCSIVWPIVVTPWRQIPQVWEHQLKLITSVEFSNLVMRMGLRYVQYPSLRDDLEAAFKTELLEPQYAKAIQSLLEDLHDPKRGGAYIRRFQPEAQGNKLLEIIINLGASALAGIIGNRADALALKLWSILTETQEEQAEPRLQSELASNSPDNLAPNREGRIIFIGSDGHSIISMLPNGYDKKTLFLSKEKIISHLNSDIHGKYIAYSRQNIDEYNFSYHIYRDGVSLNLPVLANSMPYWSPNGNCFICESGNYDSRHFYFHNMETNLFQLYNYKLSNHIKGPFGWLSNGYEFVFSGGGNFYVYNIKNETTRLIFEIKRREHPYIEEFINTRIEVIDNDQGILFNGAFHVQKGGPSLRHWKQGFINEGKYSEYWKNYAGPRVVSSAISPNKIWIAYATTSEWGGPPPYNYHIIVREVLSELDNVLSVYEINNVSHLNNIHWSPDSNKIIFQVDDKIFVYDIREKYIWNEFKYFIKGSSPIWIP